METIMVKWKATLQPNEMRKLTGQYTQCTMGIALKSMKT